jgi:hypothetical protein
VGGYTNCIAGFFFLTFFGFFSFYSFFECT